LRSPSGIQQGERIPRSLSKRSEDPAYRGCGVFNYRLKGKPMAEHDILVEGKKRKYSLAHWYGEGYH